MSKLNLNSLADEQLTEILRIGDRNDQNSAMTILLERYESKVSKSIRRKVPARDVDDVLSMVWEAFTLSTRREPIDNVGAFLNKITRNKIADFHEAQNAEVKIEKNISSIEDLDDLQGLTGPSLEDMIRQQEAIFQLEYLDAYRKFAPFINRQMSDCQRIILTLYHQFSYQYETLSRLLNKGTIEIHLHRARARIAESIRSDEFRMLLEDRPPLQSLDYAEATQADFVIDLFGEAVSPNLNEDEIKPLGLSLTEFRTHYETFLILPRWYTPKQVVDTTPPSYLVVRKEERREWIKNVKMVSMNPELEDFLFPAACLVNIDIEDDKYIKLTPEPLVELAPDLMDTNNYLISHKPRNIIPITMGFLDSSLYDEQLIQKWPFVKNIKGW